MKIKVNESVNENTLSNGQGTLVIMAGRPMFLPNQSTPIVVQKLTARQIAAIPRDRYAVAVIEPTGTVTPIPATRTGRVSPRNRRFQQHLIRRLIARKSHMLPSASRNGTEEFIAITMLWEEAYNHLKNIYIENRELYRGQQLPPPSNSDIFYPPIDEDKLSDCIKMIINQLFGNSDKIKIYSQKIKVGEFCLLMHCYFRRIKILKKEGLKPFSDYLEKKVFPEGSKFTARTFNNYANDPNYVNAKDGFIDSEKLEINFKKHPKPSGKLIDVFHEVGYNFHNSPYFDELREMRDNINNFKI